MSLWGIDVSNHQATANLSAVKAAGCAFVFVKATEGLTYTDSAYSSFRAKAAQFGLPLGAYHFARPQPGRTGAQEAAHFLSVHTQRPGDLPPVLDLEDTKLSPAATVAFALDWLNTVQKATGVRPIVYTYTGFARANLGGGTGLAQYPLWLADYRSSTTNAPSAPGPWSSWAIWQHTSTATVPGVPGNCDRNTTNLTPAQLVALGNTQEDDMFTDADRALLQNALDKADGNYIVKQFAWQNTTVAAQFAGLTAAIDALTKAQGADTADIAAVVDKAVRDRLAQIGIVDNSTKGA